MSVFNGTVSSYAISLTGAMRRLAWRVGRGLYCMARGEVKNRMAANGEAYVQDCLLAANGNALTLNVFDVGANIGDWTGMLLDKCTDYGISDIRVFCFEPTAQMHSRLIERFRSRKNVRIVQQAMSDRLGMAQIAIASRTGGTNTLEFDETLASRAIGIEDIYKSTIAEFCTAQHIAHIHFIKCDTEGHDLSVIRGARPLFEVESIDLFQFEYNHRWVYARSFLKDVFDLFTDTPYRLAKLRPKRIELLLAWHPELERFFEGNYLILHERTLPWFDVHFGTFDRSNTYA